MVLRTSFNIRQARRRNFIETFQKVSDILREESVASGLGGDALVMEDFGTTLRQSDDGEVTGWFFTYRLHPTYSHFGSLQSAAARAELRFNSLFPGNPAVRETESPEDRNSKVTVFVELGVHSVDN